MKNGFKFYALIWLALVVVFNVIAFVSVGWIGYEKYTSSFWIGYIFIMVAFVGQLICSYVALKETNINKTFYNISLVKTSFTGLIVSFVFGGMCMLISPLPYWVGILLCAIVLVLNILSVIKAFTAAKIVAVIDDEVKIETLFVKTLTVDAESLLYRAKSEVVKNECKKVYEAARYSDPMSNNALASVESKITAKFVEFSDSVISDNYEEASAFANELAVLIGERNRKCKLLK